MMQVETKYPVVANLEAFPYETNCLYGSSCLVVMKPSLRRKSLVTCLESAGALVLTADCASEAEVVLSNIRPDLVISKSNICFESGPLFISFLRSLPASQGGDLPTIAIGPETSVECARSALAVGFDQYLVEKVRGPELLRQVSNLMAKLS